MAQRKIPDTLELVESAAQEYIAEIEAGPYTIASKNSRVAHVRRFIRWLKGDLVVGADSSGGIESD